MVLLYLSEPRWADDGDGNAGKERLSVLKEVGSVLWSVMTSSGRSEARLWLCTAISSLNWVKPGDGCELFVGFLRSKKLRKRIVAAKLWHMVMEKKPQKAVPLLTKRSYILEKFFDGDSRRILQWFGNFAGVGESQHRKGAKALSQFAFVNRDSCWEELEWKGRHGQSPAVVATKPHYFLDLDVLRTVENFLEYVPDFWSSDELAESIKDGEIFSIDTNFFVEYFIRLMYEDEAKDVWKVVNEFLLEEDFSLICQQLLIFLEDADLVIFLDLLRVFVNKTSSQRSGFTCRSTWLETLLSEYEDFESIDELLLINAVISQGRKLVRFLNDEENENEKAIIEKLLVENGPGMTDASYQQLMKECLKTNKVEAIKWLGLQSWVLHYILLKKYDSTQSWESLFTENGIKFRRSDDYSLVRFDCCTDGSGSDVENGDSVSRVRKKKHKNQKKKRKKRRSNKFSDDDLLQLDYSSGEQRMDIGGRTWLLSTDGYSSSWNKVDLPEHLASHSFSTWMKWFSRKWSLSS